MKKIVLLFPGQGSQFVGMGKALDDEFPVARETFEEANDVLGFDLKRLCFEGDLIDLNKTENMLLSIFTVSVAAFRVYIREIGIRPLFAAGHSLGEYSALTCAGVISFPDALKIVKKRGTLTQAVADSGIGAMTVVNGVSVDQVEEACRKLSNDREIVSVACYNSPDQFVISGAKDAVMGVEDNLSALGGQITPLLMSAPFHCVLMQKAAAELSEELKKYQYHRFDFPVISNVFGLPYFEPEKIIDNLTLQLVRPVQWQAIMNYFNDQGIELALEMGPQAVLTNLVDANTKNITAYSFGQKDDRDTLIKALNKGQPNNPHLYYGPTVVTKCLAMAVCTKNRNFDEQEYEVGVIEPYEKIQKIQDDLDKEGKYPTTAEMKQSLECLRQIFQTKKVPLEDQLRRFKRVFDESGAGKLFEDFEWPTQIAIK